MRSRWLLVCAMTLACATATAFAGPALQGEPTNDAERAAKKQAADAAADARYRAVVEKLRPDEQAWEKVLEENLGSFYLPLHKRARVEGRSTCWDFVEDDPALPRVLLIGDSISGGYTLPVRSALAGRANVHKAPENCGSVQNGLRKLDTWLGDGRWDVIHFNFGLHDSGTPRDVYETRLREFVARLKRTRATLVWASTTPRPAEALPGQPPARAVVERNEIAARIMAEEGIAVDDLHAAIEPRLAEFQRPKDVHFTPEGYAELGRAVAASIDRVLPRRGEPRPASTPTAGDAP